jgi:hypothetical protein
MKIQLQPCGTWTADLVGSPHQFSFDTTDRTEFVSLGFEGRGVRFRITPLGVLETVTDIKSDDPLTELVFPKHHALSRDITIGKPYKG